MADQKHEKHADEAASGDEAIFAADESQAGADHAAAGGAGEAAQDAGVHDAGPAIAAPAPAPRKKGRYWQKLTLGVAFAGLLATVGGVVAMRFKDRDPRLGAVADFIESVSRNPKATLLALEDKARALLPTDTVAPKVPAPLPAPPGLAELNAGTAQQTAPAQGPTGEPAPLKPSPSPSPGWAAPHELRQDPVKEPEALRAPAKPEPAPAESAPAKTQESAPTAPETAPAPLAAARADMEAVTQRIDRLESATEEALRWAKEARAAARGEEGNYLNALEGRIDELADEIRKVRERLDSPKAETRLVQEPAQAKPAQSVTGKAGAVVVLAESLNRELDRGRPYAHEQAALAALGVDPELLATLAPSAESGAPTPAQLLESFAPIAKRIRSTETSADGSLTDKLLQHAGKLVRVRPVGESQTDSGADIAGQIETALKRDDVDAAAAAFDKLPDNAKAEAKSFGDALGRRRAADKAAAALLANAIDALAQTKN